MCLDIPWDWIAPLCYICVTLYTQSWSWVWLLQKMTSYPHSWACKFWNLKTGPLPSVALMAPTFFSQLHYLRTCIAKCFVNYNRAISMIQLPLLNRFMDFHSTTTSLEVWCCIVFPLHIWWLLGGIWCKLTIPVVSSTSFLFLIHPFHAHGNFVVFRHSGGKEGVLVFWQLDTGKKKFLPRIGSPLLYFTTSLDPSLSSVRFF